MSNQNKIKELKLILIDSEERCNMFENISILYWKNKQKLDVQIEELKNKIIYLESDIESKEAARIFYEDLTEQASKLCLQLREDKKELFKALSIYMCMTENNLSGMEYGLNVYNKFKDELK